MSLRILFTRECLNNYSKILLSMYLQVILTIFVLVQETSLSSNFKLHADMRASPLALIKKHNSSKLQLAIPQKPKENNDYAEYPQDDSKDGNQTEFKIACPAFEVVSTEHSLETKWRKSSNAPNYARLLILHDYTRPSFLCPKRILPMIEKSQKTDKNNIVEYCGQFKAEVYNVGFPVSNHYGTVSQLEQSAKSDIQFIPIYKVCHSAAKEKGTLYTVHRIVSPSLLLNEAWNYYTRPSITDVYKSSLDGSSHSVEQLLNKEQYPYPFVGSEDMPTKVWRSTTKFLFNYTSVALNEDLINGMVTVDNFIRLYSKETHKPLTLYSGMYQTTIKEKSIYCWTIFCDTSTPMSVFWRIIIDDEGLATIIITQNMKMKCIDEDYICNDGRILVKEYEKGGCTYVCSVNEDLIHQLGLPHNEAMQRLDLPQLKITGFLTLTFPRKMTNNLKPSENRQAASSEKFSKEVRMIDFFGQDNFKNALMSADPGLASTMKFHESFDQMSSPMI